jgi:nucleoside-diphosphate-sugar epimerase
MPCGVGGVKRGEGKDAFDVSNTPERVGSLHMTTQAQTTRAHTLITGATGFLGRHLLPALGAEGVEITALTRAGRAPAGFGEVGERVRWLAADMEDLDVSVLPEGVDTVLHMSAPTPRSAPLGAHQRHTVEGTRRLLAWAKGAGVKHVAFLSTVNVYAPAEGERVLFDESAAFVEPNGLNATDYGLTKLEAERLLLDAAEGFGATAIFRPAMIYGQGMSGRSPLSYLERALQTGEQITLAQPDGHYLTPVFVADVVDVLTRWLAEPFSGTFNLGGPQSYTEGELARALAEHLMTPIAFIDNPSPAISLAISSARLNGVLPDRTQTALRHGIERTWHL